VDGGSDSKCVIQSTCGQLRRTRHISIEAIALGLPEKADCFQTHVQSWGRTADLVDRYG